MKIPSATAFLFFAVLGAVSAPAGEPEKSVVHVFTTVQYPKWDAPWHFEPVQEITGSGFVIAGRRIVTNAHVVSWAQQILVRRHQDPRFYVARVKFVAHDCDLALLELEDASFFEGLTPFELGGLPKVRSTVFTYGYPAGGDQLSCTRGVVSRIEVQVYSHNGIRDFLAVQTDAAINPGNSGGPVIQEGKVVGVAFQGISGLENTGFFIPTPVIRHFLADVEDGTYDGFPQAGLAVAPLENPAYRRYLKMPDNRLGARVDAVRPWPSTSKLIRPDDVLLQVGPFPVASDATILYEGNRVSASAAFDQAQHRGNLAVRLWRDGREVSVSLPMMVHREDRAQTEQYDALPRYFVYGGLVFLPLSLDYLKTLGDNANPEMRYQLFCRNDDHPEDPREEPVVLATILDHAVNADLKTRGPSPVEKINGVRINKLDDVIRAIESNQAKHHVFQFGSSGDFETLPREAANAANAAIREANRIPKDRR